MYEIFENQEDNKEILKAYLDMQNYKVVDFNRDGYCYIFFTSHGLFFPTNVEEFRKEIVERDKFEWGNIGSERRLQEKASIQIFVRDIYKNFCIEGINVELNSQDKMAEKLRELAAGRKIITVGSSAGGYMAILFGCLLNAESIYAFSPQISLNIYNCFHKIKYFDKYCTEQHYLDLKKLLVNYSGSVYFFYANGCAEDIAQYEHIKDLTKIRFFSVNGKEHGAPLYGISIREILCMPYRKLDALCCKFKNRKVSSEKILFCTNNPLESVPFIIGRCLKRELRSIKKNRRKLIGR